MYKQGLYISENLRFSDIQADNDQLLPNYTASHRNCPQALYTSLQKSHGSIRKEISVY